MENTTNIIFTPYDLDNNGKNRNSNNEILIYTTKDLSLKILLFFLGLPGIIFIYPAYLVWCRTPMSTYIIIDEIKEELLLAGEGIFSCCHCTRFIQKTYYLSEIKKIRIYLSSIPDPKIGFHKFYFINCDVYS